LIIDLLWEQNSVLMEKVVNMDFMGIMIFCPNKKVMIENSKQE